MTSSASVLAQWRSTITLVGIWGIATWLFESAVLPLPAFGGVTLVDWISLVSSRFVQWFFSGIGMAICVIWAEAHFDVRTIVLIVACYASALPSLPTFVYLPMGCKLGWLSLSPDFFPGIAHVCDSPGKNGMWAYVLWEVLVIAATFTPVYVLGARAARTSNLLGRAEIALRQADETVEQVQLTLLQRQVDPSFLSAVMETLQQRYAVDPRSADRLLDRLVVFLRHLMPVLSHRRSTLDAELNLLCVHAHLHDELESVPARWSIDADLGTMGSTAFPTMLLLPVIEALSRNVSPRPAWQVRACRINDEIFLSIHVATSVQRDTVAALERQIALGLQSVFGDDGIRRVRCIGSEGVSITLVYQPPATEPPPAAAACITRSEPAFERLLPATAQ